jgi:hypothetical protein
MGRIELSEENKQKTSCLSSILSVFSGSKAEEQQEFNEKSSFPPYTDIEPVYKVM